jgi:hypothetical protein
MPGTTTAEDVNALLTLIRMTDSSAGIMQDVAQAIEKFTLAGAFVSSFAGEIADVVETVDRLGKCTLIVRPDSDLMRAFRLCCELAKELETCCGK